MTLKDLAEILINDLDETGIKNYIEYQDRMRSCAVRMNRNPDIYSRQKGAGEIALALKKIMRKNGDG